MIRKTSLFLILAILISLGIYETIAVNQFLNHMTRVVDHIQIEIKSNEENITVLYNYVKDEKEYWEEKEKNLNLMFNHKDLQTVCDTMNRLQTYVGQNDYENALVEVNVLVETVHELRSVMGFNFDNIL